MWLGAHDEAVLEERRERGDDLLLANVPEARGDARRGVVVRVVAKRLQHPLEEDGARTFTGDVWHSHETEGTEARGLLTGCSCDR